MQEEGNKQNERAFEKPNSHSNLMKGDRGQCEQGSLRR